MESYPISVPHLRPKDARRWPQSILSESRKKLEDYLNEIAKNSSEDSLTFFHIAHEADIDREIVKLYLRQMTGHSSGITVGNPELKKETGR